MVSAPAPRAGLGAIACLALPAALDGTRQYVFGHESTTLRRIATGALLGLAMSLSADLVARTWHVRHSPSEAVGQLVR
jgi:uncharacterized membrane protein